MALQTVDVADCGYDDEQLQLQPRLDLWHGTFHHGEELELDLDAEEGVQKETC